MLHCADFSTVKENNVAYVLGRVAKNNICFNLRSFIVARNFRAIGRK